MWHMVDAQSSLLISTEAKVEINDVYRLALQGKTHFNKTLNSLTHRNNNNKNVDISVSPGEPEPGYGGD